MGRSAQVDCASIAPIITQVTGTAVQQGLDSDLFAAPGAARVGAVAGPDHHLGPRGCCVDACAQVRYLQPAARTSLLTMHQTATCCTYIAAPQWLECLHSVCCAVALPQPAGCRSLNNNSCNTVIDDTCCTADAGCRQKWAGFCRCWCRWKLNNKWQQAGCLAVYLLYISFLVRTQDAGKGGRPAVRAGAACAGGPRCRP